MVYMDTGRKLGNFGSRHDDGTNAGCTGPGSKPAGIGTAGAGEKTAVVMATRS